MDTGRATDPNPLRRRRRCRCRCRQELIWESGSVFGPSRPNVKVISTDAIRSVCGFYAGRAGGFGFAKEVVGYAHAHGSELVEDLLGFTQFVCSTCCPRPEGGDPDWRWHKHTERRENPRLGAGGVGDPSRENTAFLGAPRGFRNVEIASMGRSA